MALQRTFSIIKPDAVAKNVIGEIYSRFEQAGLKVVAARMKHLSKQEAEGFYAVHRERPFFSSLVAFMTEGPVIPVALERADGADPVPALREVMGATDVAKAAEGTVRKLFGTSIERNAIHGSDSPENARIELGFFFPQADLVAAL